VNVTGLASLLNQTEVQTRYYMSRNCWFWLLLSATEG